MAPLIAFGRSIAIGFCMASATINANAASNNCGGECATTGGLSAGPLGSETFSENASSDGEIGSVEDGDGNGDGGGGRRGGRGPNTGRDGAWISSSEVVDLEELADRVSDALVAADAQLDGERTALLVGSTSSSPATPRPVCLGQTTETLCEQEHSGDSGRNGQRAGLSSNGDGAMAAKMAEEFGATTNQAAEESTRASLSVPEGAGGETAAGAEVAEVCGEGEHRRTCNEGEECCNRSCGICAPKGQSCLKITCGGLTRGGGSPKVTRPGLAKSYNSEAATGAQRSGGAQDQRTRDRLPASPASRESHISQRTAKKEEVKDAVDRPKHETPDDRGGEQRWQPKTTGTDILAHGRKFPSSDSLRRNRSARGRDEAAKMAASARESFSATLRSSFDGQGEEEEAA